MSFVAANGVNFHYKLEGHGPLVVLLHEIGGSLDSWDGVVPSLAERFMHFVGQPPMHYLTHWRMQMAAGLLSDGTRSVATIAEDVGYESEAAFSRAFKKLVGAPPASWRRQRRAAIQAT